MCAVEIVVMARIYSAVVPPTRGSSFKVTMRHVNTSVKDVDVSAFSFESVIVKPTIQRTIGLIDTIEAPHTIASYALGIHVHNDILFR